ncbi:SNF2-related protein [Lichenihabitans sp. Uapishka_5]|uniref:DEAD/DEAH box helicase family protein n=1 Tax=Lichenihabitans sp. Uapishka_5 TaxID=3037302 RepID=UPI0029E7CE9F|nr:DEAD/DEAH box helicase family protein [Lichenihabitans sp. Uapishka_5]MDX7950274.1 SNF2-related protein [Lichenihabitans sp. Uapishka_5]
MQASVPHQECLSAAPDVLVPRPHQRIARDAIAAARLAGRPGFLLGDLTGLGKTLSAWAAIAAMPEDDVLIVCPKGAMPQWRRTIAQSGLAPKRVTLINYERTKALLAPPPASTRRSPRAKNNELARQGRPKQVWPIVLFDESHRLRNPYAQQTMACRQMADAATFVLYLSATAGQSPHELGYLGRLLGHAAGQPTETLADFRQLMKGLGIGRAKGRWMNWTWEPNERDRRIIADLLYKGPNAIGIRRHPGDIAGWPAVQRELAPTMLTPAERRLYDATWRDFRRELGLLGGSTRRPAGWAADLRFRQKASLLRVAGTVAFAEDLLEAGQQVALSVAFLETGTALTDTLGGRGWRVGQIDGRASAEANEATRIAFQTGQLDVVTFTVTESISLHSNELPGGHRPRSLIVHDMRYSAIQLQQIEGRCHRDGEMAIIYYAFGEDTVEEEVTATVIARMAAMHGLAGDDAALLDALTGFLDYEA